MPRKPHYDLRDYWLWFERHWPLYPRGGLFSGPVRPPFELEDIARPEPYRRVSPRIERAFLLLLLMLAALAVGGLLWLVFVAK
jgi:hypothetical protein